MSDRTYIAIDLKSFYASVECADRRLAPLATNLVVSDESRMEKTICVAVSPPRTWRSTLASCWRMTCRRHTALAEAES